MAGVNSHVTTVANNVGSSGSLTAITQLNFSGSGHIQSTFTISSSGVPEPGTVGRGWASVGCLRPQVAPQTANKLKITCQSERLAVRA
jgi:hypothetical protein